MSWFSDLFTSPRERAAPGLYQKQMQSYGNLMSQAQGLQDPYAGINAGNVYSQFGVAPTNISQYQKDVAGTYAPLYQNLATAAAKSRAAAAGRMRASSASPGVAFNPIDSSYATALNQLQSQQGEQALKGYNMQQQQQEFMANLLNNVFGNQQNFGFQREGLQRNILGDQSQAIGSYLNSLSDTSTFGDLMAGLGTAAQIGSLFIPGVGPAISAGIGLAKAKTMPAQGGYSLT